MGSRRGLIRKVKDVSPFDIWAGLYRISVGLKDTTSGRIIAGPTGDSNAPRHPREGTG